MTLKKKWFILCASALCMQSFLFAATQEETPNGMAMLEQTSKAFTGIAKKAMPATVFIKASVCGPCRGEGSPFDFYGDDFFQRFFGPFGRPQSPPPTQTASGSGFFISSDGYIITNCHVIKDAKEITVILNDGRELEATVKGCDPRTDLAVLQVEGKDFPSLEFGDSDDLDIGEWVVAIGNPFALQSSLTVGVVSAKGRQDLGIAAFEDFIQTDAAINPGNSGGPLLNLHSQVIGVNTAIMSRSGGYMGIGLAIPSKMVQHISQQIIEEGTVKRAYLGVLLQPVDKELAEAMGLDNQEGILISDVVKNSPAEKAGLKQGDLILSYNKKSAKTISQFRNDIAMLPPGSEVDLLILRNGKTMRVQVSVETQVEGEVLSAELIQKLGLEVDALTPEMISRLGLSSEATGVVITKIKPGSLAASAGLRPGFLIVGVATDLTHQTPVHSVEDFEKALETTAKKKYLILIVRHQNYQRYYTLKIN